MFKKTAKVMFGETIKFGVEEARRLEEEGKFDAAIRALDSVLERYPKKRRFKERYRSQLIIKKAEDDVEKAIKILESGEASKEQIRSCFGARKFAMDVLRPDNSELNILTTELMRQAPLFLKKRLEKGDDLDGYAACLIGQEILFDLYEVIDVLGRGGFGVTFLCHDKNQDRECAIKLIPSGDKEQFDSEVRIQARLGKSYKVPIVYSSDQIGADFYMVMEYMQGGDLRKRITGRTLPEEEAISVVIQVCDILDTAHKEGICHLDIKPENILFGGDMEVKIADFGLARFDGSNQPQLLAGTTYYTAPEIIDGKVGDHLSDIYSLGVVLWEILGNAMPVSNKSNESNVTGDLVRICKKATFKKSEARFQSIKEMLWDLKGYSNSSFRQRDDGPNRPAKEADYDEPFSDDMVEIPASTLKYLDMEFKVSDFLVDKYPINRGFFNKFITSGLCQPESEIIPFILKKIWTKDGMEWLKNNPRKPLSNKDMDLNWGEYVDDITWYEAVAFCNWRSIMAFAPGIFEKKHTREISSGLKGILYYDDDGPRRHGDGMGFRLPTEFELEIVKRFFNSKTQLKSPDNFYEITNGTYHSIGELKRYADRVDPIPYINQGTMRTIINRRLNRIPVPPDCRSTYEIGFRCVLRKQ